MSNITKEFNNLSINEHGTHAGFSPLLEGTKNWSSIPDPNTTVAHVPSDSPNHTLAGNKNSHDGKPSATDHQNFVNGSIPMLNSSGLHSYPAPFPIPPGQPTFSYGYPYFYPYMDPRLQPSYTPHYPNPTYLPLPLSTTTSTTEPNISSTSNIGNTSTSFINHKLHIITNPTEFIDWISTFGDYLRENDMGYCVPLSEENVGALSPKDKDFLITIFNSFVQSSAYPTWFTEYIRQPYLTLDKSIQLALLRYGKTKKIHHYLHELINIKFTKTTDIATLGLHIASLQEQCSKLGIQVPESVIINSILDHLPEGYEYIRVDYYRHDQTHGLNDILRSIAAHHNHYRPSKSTNSSSLHSTICQLCSKKGPTAKNCSGTSPSNGKKSFKFKDSPKPNDNKKKSTIIKKVTIDNLFEESGSLRPHSPLPLNTHHYYFFSEIQKSTSIFHHRYRC